MKKLGMKIQGVKKWQLSNISEPSQKLQSFLMNQN